MESKYQVGGHTKCPHCRQGVELISTKYKTQAGQPVNEIAADQNKVFFLSRCPLCKEAILAQRQGSSWTLLVPRATTRAMPSSSVPSGISADYREASEVLAISPKASAALARRALQSLLRDQGAKHADLFTEIEEMAPKLPGYIQPFVDGIRKGGNISAHPRISTASMEIVDVEPGEAEWLLDLLDMLFDHYYDKPALSKAKMAAIDEKYSSSK